MRLDKVQRSRDIYNRVVQNTRRGKRSKESARKDRVEISTGAVGARKHTRVSEAVSKAPDIRAEEVQAARTKLAEGEYDKPEVIRKTAQRLERLLD